MKTESELRVRIFCDVVAKCTIYENAAHIVVEEIIWRLDRLDPPILEALQKKENLPLLFKTALNRQFKDKKINTFTFGLAHEVKTRKNSK